MSDIPSNKQKIQQESVAPGSPVSQFLFNEIGGSINDIVEGFKKVEFTTPGADTWTVPDGLFRVWVQAIGGGGAGGCAGTNAVSGVPTGAAGGGAAVEYGQWFDVTPGNIINLTVGAAGVGTTGFTVGGQGGDSIFDGVTLSKGGYGGRNNPFGFTGDLQGGSGGFTAVPNAGKGGDATFVSSGTTTLQDGFASWMDLVSGGSKSSPNGGGGGGASVYGSGGNGGASGGGNGNAPAGTAYGAGGGGAGGNIAVFYTGGNGMSGKVTIIYI